ncbi:MAG: hypothetical protein ISN29_02305 [Gammaproteobacteria bacterium AqS3]|nr:hypothetical protein [Gammaproteobacteria bacterium AqS3]
MDIPSAWLEAGASAIEVVRALRSRQHKAYLVGGCVRDLLLDTIPHDFDVATSARPKQIISLFGPRRARRVGRRFPIVLVRAGERGAAPVEVTTFRGEGSRVDSSANGQIRRDISYGSLRQDVLRRDLSINALYLDLDQGCVFDHVDGIEDIQQGLIRIIGDPPLRLREDPVRLLRCVRFAARLELDFAAETRAALDGSGMLLRAVSPARLYDEFYKTLAHDRWECAWELLLELDALRHAFPMLAAALNDPSSGQGALLETALEALAESSDRLRGARRQILFYAAVLWGALERALAAAGRDAPGDRSDALGDVGLLLLQQLSVNIRVPEPHRARMLNLWRLQGRLEARVEPHHTVAASSFDDALALLGWRIRAGMIEDAGRLHFWRSQQRPSPSETRRRRNWDGSEEEERRSGERSGHRRERRRHGRRRRS